MRLRESITHSRSEAQAEGRPPTTSQTGAPPSLVSRDITDHFTGSGENPSKKTASLPLGDVGEAGSTWMHELEMATEAHRLARRAHHVAEAERAGDEIRTLLGAWGLGGARRERRALPSRELMPDARERAALEVSTHELEELEDAIALELERAMAPRDLRESETGREAFANTLAGVDGRGGIANRVRWHLGRAKGQGRRFSDVRTCGEGGGAIVRECGGSSTFCHACRIGRVCVSCRAHMAMQRRARFGRGRVHALENARREGLFRRGRVLNAPGGGTWAERHLTLTAPHSMSAGDAIRAMFIAWREFSKAFSRWTRSKPYRAIHGYNRPDFWRAFEWTPGSDGLGHPHFHVWMLSPFLPVDKVRDWWTLALRKAGFAGVIDRREAKRQGVPPSFARIDLRMIRTPSGDFGRELFKRENAIRMSELHVQREGGEIVQAYADGWTLTEVYKPKHGGKNVRIDPELAARVYEGLEARRLAQSSRRFSSLEPDRKPCPHCGTDGCPARIVLVKPGAEYHARLYEAMRLASLRFAETGRGPPPS